MTTLQTKGGTPAAAGGGPYIELYLLPMAASPEGYDDPDDNPDLGPQQAGWEFFGQLHGVVDPNPAFVHATAEFTALPTVSITGWGNEEEPAVWHAFPNSPNTALVHFYSMTFTDITDLEDESELGYYTTTGTVPVGGSVTGNINVAHDADWFRVELEEGKTYRISLRGAETNGGTLADPYLRLKIGQDDFLINAINAPFNDDKSATEKDSEITFTTPTGSFAVEEYYLEANTKTDGTGTYTIEVVEVTSP